MAQTHTVKRGGGVITGNITVGQLVPCRFRIFIYDAKGKMIEGDGPNGSHANGLVIDDTIPEYEIGPKVYAPLQEFWISHEYTLAAPAPGDFIAVVSFNQHGGQVTPRSDHISADQPGTAGSYYHHVKFVQS